MSSQILLESLPHTLKPFAISDRQINDLKEISNGRRQSVNSYQKGHLSSA